MIKENRTNRVTERKKIENKTRLNKKHRKEANYYSVVNKN